MGYNPSSTLHLAKQRWRYRDCCHTLSTTFHPIVAANCFISENTKLSAILDIKEKISQKDIVSALNISLGTFNIPLRQ